MWDRINKHLCGPEKMTKMTNNMQVMKHKTQFLEYFFRTKNNSEKYFEINFRKLEFKQPDELLNA